MSVKFLQEQRRCKAQKVACLEVLFPTLKDVTRNFDTSDAPYDVLLGPSKAENPLIVRSCYLLNSLNLDDL